MDDSFSMRATCFGIRKRFPSVQQLSTEILASWLEQKKQVLLIDSRPDEEYKISKLEGAERVEPDFTDESLDNLKSLVDQTSPNQPVICYCSVGYRSSKQAELLQKKLSSDPLRKNQPVYNLEGSIFKWANENRPIVDCSGSPTEKVHPYNSLWGKLLYASKRYDT